MKPEPRDAPNVPALVAYGTRRLALSAAGRFGGSRTDWFSLLRIGESGVRSTTAVRLVGGYSVTPTASTSILKP